MNSGERITFAIEQSGQKPSAVARVCGVSRSAVSQWMAGNTKSLKPENLFGVAVATGFSAQWLGTGEGPMRADENAEPVAPTDSNRGGANAQRIIDAIVSLDRDGRLPDALADAILAMLRTAPAGASNVRTESAPGVIKRHTTAEAIAAVDLQANKGQLIKYKDQTIKAIKQPKNKSIDIREEESHSKQ